MQEFEMNNLDGQSKLYYKQLILRG